jgi:hypothetical protein
MEKLVRVEISACDHFWRNAVLVEWQHQFPERELISESSGFHLIRGEWLADLERVGKQCLATVTLAPVNPSRRLWFRSLLLSTTAPKPAR